MKRLHGHVPTLIAGVIALNGFFNLAAGLVHIFQLASYLKPADLGGEAVTEYLDVTASLQVGGAVAVLLGLMLINLGRGLLARRRRSWYWTLSALGALLVYLLLRNASFGRILPTLLLLGLLVVLRREFQRETPPGRKWSYAELVAVVSVLFALVYGTLGSYLLRNGFATIAGWTDAVYFTVITYSTLGYGDILPVTDTAKLFTISMVLIGLSSFVTALTVLLGPLIEERMKGVFSVMSRFQRTANHVVVCGFTHVTESIVDELREQSVPFLIIEEHEEMALHLKDRGLDAAWGDPTERHVLEQANLPDAAAVIAATDSDATNILIALTARGLRQDTENDFRIIVRVEDEENIDKVREIGVNEVISPSTMAGRLMATKALESR